MPSIQYPASSIQHPASRNQHPISRILYLASMNRKRLLRWAQIIIIVYCSIGIALYYLQEKFLFHPEALPRGQAYAFDMPFEEIDIPFNQADTINLVKFFPKDSVRRGVVLYYHGNRQHIGRYAKFAEHFTRAGYEVWMEDFPGFCKSTGERSEKKLYEQAMQVRKMAAAAAVAFWQLRAPETTEN